MADENNGAGNNPSQNGVDNSNSDDALLFDEATVLSRSDAAEEEKEEFDNSEVNIGSEDSGNENIQASIEDSSDFRHAQYAAGTTVEEGIAAAAVNSDEESITEVVEEEVSEGGRQDGISEEETPTQDGSTPDIPDELAETDGESEEPVFDFIDPVVTTTVSQPGEPETRISDADSDSDSDSDS
ncbi:MAG: hypothetical protein R3204_15980, partial [Oceanospirillum sp.]|nr:hypothetical protein [Oceanospirillum sp.]